MTAVDTSVVVAALASWHEAHDSTVAALARKPRLPAHVLIESYSVLTRLPSPHRAAGAVVLNSSRRNSAATCSCFRSPLIAS